MRARLIRMADGVSAMDKGHGTMFNKSGGVRHCTREVNAGVLPAPVNNARSGGTTAGSCAPAADAQYPRQNKGMPATTIVRLLYPYPRNTNARLRMTLQKFAWHQPFFSIFSTFRKAIFVRRGRYRRGKLHSFRATEEHCEWSDAEYCAEQRRAIAFCWYYCPVLLDV